MIDDELAPARPGTLILGSSGLAPAERTLLDILVATAGHHPDAPAIDDGQQCLSYAQLVDAVTEMAHSLVARGVARGDRVGVRLPSGSCRLYVAILGVLAAGAAYVPVDADDPEERARLERLMHQVRQTIELPVTAVA